MNWWSLCLVDCFEYLIGWNVHNLEFFISSSFWNISSQKVFLLLPFGDAYWTRRMFIRCFCFFWFFYLFEGKQMLPWYAGALGLRARWNFYLKFFQHHNSMVRRGLRTVPIKQGGTSFSDWWMKLFCIFSQNKNPM